MGFQNPRIYIGFVNPKTQGWEDNHTHFPENKP